MGGHVVTRSWGGLRLRLRLHLVSWHSGVISSRRGGEERGELGAAHPIATPMPTNMMMMMKLLMPSSAIETAVARGERAGL